MNNIRHKLFISAAILTLPIGLAFCSQGDALIEQSDRVSDTQSQQVHEGKILPQFILSDEIPEKDQRRWVTPTDVYYKGSGALKVDALVSIEVRCMREAGYADYPMHLIPFAPSSETTAADGFSYLFNEETAAKYGYRLAADPGMKMDVKIPDYDAMPVEYQETYDRCYMQAMEQMNDGIIEDEDLPSPEEMTEDYILKQRETIGSQLNRLDVDFSDSDLVAAALRWRECMAPLGIVDLPERPYWMTPGGIPESLKIRWSWETWGEPSADEISIATHDAHCRRSSGWFDTLYEKEWTLKEEFVTAHREELAPLLEQEQKMLTRAIEVLAENGYTPQ